MHFLKLMTKNACVGGSVSADQWDIYLEVAVLAVTPSSVFTKNNRFSPPNAHG